MNHQDVSRKIAFFNIDEQDTARFAEVGKQIQRHAPAALERLYRQIAATPETAGFFSSRGLMDHAKAKQMEHWAEMFSRRVDAHTFESGAKIGHVHSRIGLEPQWYIGAYAAVLDEVVIAMSGALGKRHARLIGTLIKMAMLDMDIALSTYFEAAEKKVARWSPKHWARRCAAWPRVISRLRSKHSGRAMRTSTATSRRCATRSAMR